MKPASGSPRPSLIRIVLSCMMLVLIPAESANAVELLDPSNVTDISFESNTTRAKDIFDLPADHFLHQPQMIVNSTELFMEWVYWTGELKDTETGDLYGIQYTLFHLNILPGLIGYANHVAVSDTRNRQHSFYGYAALPGSAGISSGNDETKGTYWRYEDNQTTLTYWNASDAWNILTQGNVSTVSGGEKKISLNLTLVNDRVDYYPETPNGTNEQGACLDIGSENMAGRSYYYSHPALNTTGTITLDGRNINVQGDCWFDHQWGGFGKCLLAWDWFSIRLDNGSYLMLYSLKDQSLNDVPSQRHLTYIDPIGNITWWHGEDAANFTPIRWWKADQLGTKYPLDWILDTPLGRFAVEPYFDDQAMDVPGSPIKYWEGIMRVRARDLHGEQIGTGYMELTGYAPLASQRAS